MVALALASLAVVLAAVLLASRLTARGTMAALLAVGLLTWGIIATTVGVAGLLVRDLSPTTLVLLSMGWLGTGVAVAGWRGRDPHLGARLTGSVRASISVLRWPPVAMAAGLLALTLAWRLFLALRLPVVDLLGWQYHLVTVEVWLQANAIVPVTQTWWSQGYPADGELVTAWLAAFTHSDVLTGLTGLLPIPLAVVAVTGLARSLGASRGPALLVGLLFGLMPAVVALAGTTYVDTASVASLAAAWWLGLRVARGERDASAALLFGIAVGLAIGTKQSNVLLVGPMVAGLGVLLAVEVLRAARASRRLPPRAPILTAIVAFAVPAAALGLSWYAKNLALYGNPAFPYMVGPLPGVVTASDSLTTPTPRLLMDLGSVQQIVTSWLHDWSLWSYPYNVRGGGFGRAWPALAAVAILGAVDLARRRAMIPWILVIAPAVVTLLAAPNGWYARLTLFVPAIALPLAALGLEKVPRRARTPVALVLVAIAAISVAAANLAPNIDVASHGDRVQRAISYLQLVVSGSDAERSNVDRRSRCSDSGIIPVGARVAVAQLYVVAHAVAGPSMDRILTEPIVDATDAQGLRQAMSSRGATWLVAPGNGNVWRVARSDPQHFVPAGRICDGAIFRFDAAGGA